MQRNLSGNNPNIVYAGDYEHKGKIAGTRRIGIVSGSFAPLHAGHLSLVEKSRIECDATVVLVGGHAGDKGEARGMPLHERYKRCRVEFDDASNVYVACIEEPGAIPFDDEEGLASFNDSLEEVLAAYVEDDRDSYDVVKYVGQPDYLEILSRLDPPEYAHAMLDRFDDSFPTCGMSATEISQDPLSYWSYIADSFKCFYRKCVLLVGAESTGKSTLSELLARHYGTSCTREYGRDWTGGWRHSIESELDEKDYLAFVAGQLDYNESTLMEKSDDKIVFLDTDGFVTSTYLRVESENMDFRLVDALYDVAGISRAWTCKHVDAVFVLPNDVLFEMDGSRDGHLAGSRDAYRDALVEMMRAESGGVLARRMHLISEGTLGEKLAECIAICDGLLR